MRFAVVVSALALLLIPSVAGAAEAPEILYSVETRGAAVVKSGKALRLSLPANARTTWFTDRPGRRAGSAPVARLVRVWDASGFRADPPNAALLLTDRGVTRTHVVRLSDPRRSRGRVSFRVRVVRGGEVAGHRQTDPLRRGRYGRAALFIDDAAYPPCPAFITRFSTCLLPPQAVTQVSASGSLGYWQVPVSACGYGQWSASAFPIVQLLPMGQTIPSAVPGDPPRVGAEFPVGNGPVLVAACSAGDLVATLNLDPLGLPGATTGVTVFTGFSASHDAALLLRVGP